MHPAFRILKNSTALAVTALVERGVGLLLPLYIVRTQGPGLWGDYNIALAFILVIVPFGSWGLDKLLPREIARSQSQPGEYLGGAIVINGIAAVLFSGGALVVVRLLEYPAELERLIALAVLTNTLPRSVAAVHEATINGLERMEWIALIRLPLTVIRTVAAISFLVAGWRIPVLFVLLGIQYILMSLLYLRVMYRSLPEFTLRLNPPMLRQLTIGSIPMVLIIFAGATFTQIDRIFLSTWWDAATVGQYAAGALPMDVLRTLVPTFMMALFPILSRAYARSTDRFAEITQKLYKYIFLAGFPAVILFISLADWGIDLIFGAQYAASANVLRILAIGILFLTTGQLFYHVLLASDNEPLALQTAILRGLANIVLNIILIPRYGMLGASIALTSTEFIGWLRNFFHVRNKIIPFDVQYAVLRPATYMLVCIALFFILTQWSLVGAGAVVVAIYVILLFASSTISRDELKELIQPRSA